MHFTTDTADSWILLTLDITVDLHSESDTIDDLCDQINKLRYILITSHIISIIKSTSLLCTLGIMYCCFTLVGFHRGVYTRLHHSQQVPTQDTHKGGDTLQQSRLCPSANLFLSKCSTSYQ